MNIKEIKQFLGATDLCGQSPLISGKHGLGKSDTIRQYAKENDMHCEVLILSLMDTGDLCGLPRTASIGGQLSTVWAAPAWLTRIINAAWAEEVSFDDLTFVDPAFKEYVSSHIERVSSKLTRDTLNSLYCSFYNISEDGLYLHLQDKVTWKHSKRSVLFLDELNRSPVDILNASLQLILDKRLNDHQLPIVNGQVTFVAAAINPADQDYTVNSFDPALLDRFVTATIDPDITSWLEWARSSNVAPIIRDFLAEHPDRLHFTDEKESTSATPRSWASLSRTMLNVDRISPDILPSLMKGHLGTSLSAQFLAYYNNYFKVIKMSDVEKVITTKSKTVKDVEKLGEYVNKLIDSQEAIQKHELAEQFYDKYIKKDTLDDIKPLLTFLYGLDLEILNGFLKSKKDSDFDNYMKLSKFDGELNSKKLFLRITTKAK